MASTPAASTVRADGASYAVTITIGDPVPLRASRPGAVIRGLEEAIPATSCVQGTSGSRRNRRRIYDLAVRPEEGEVREAGIPPSTRPTNQDACSRPWSD